MDFDDTREEAAFREEARAWITENRPTEEERMAGEYIDYAQMWQKRKYDAGWACLSWPEEYGGRGASPIEQVIWSQEEARINPPIGIFSIGMGMVAPTLLTWASSAIKKQVLPKLGSGEEIWCQLFSEPAGGSDLAALRTTAIREGDEWVINGQKTWTSGAHYSRWGILMVRSDASLPKHAGITFFIVEMDSPGMEIRPIRQMTGEALFNEVYFDNVRIPDRYRIGEVGQGWQVGLTTLMNERVVVDHGDGHAGVQALLELSERLVIDGRPAIESDAVVDRLADWYCQEAGLKYTGYRALSALSRGETPGPENSISKLVGARKTQEVSSFAMDLMGHAGIRSGDLNDPYRGLFPSTYLDIPGIRIAGGSDEILLNIIAERVLGMPQDVRADKGIPF